MNRHLKSLIDKLEKYELINSKNTAIYYYGFEILFSSTITSLSILLVSNILNSIICGVIYLFITIPLRSTLGGYHAKTYLRCFIQSILLYSVISVFCAFLVAQHFSMLPAYILLIASIIHLYFSKPTKNPQHPISDDILFRNKYIAKHFIIIDIILILLLIVLNIDAEIIMLSISSIISVSFLKIII